MEEGQKFYEMDDISQKLKQTAENTLYDLVLKEEFNSVLDIGCGDGHFIKRFKDKDVFGIDINQTMLDESSGLEGKLGKINIITDESFIRESVNKYDIITSNYVFTEFKQEELFSAFKNINSILQEDGLFYFTITDPRTRGRTIFPGYKLVFDEEYSYEKEDLPFTVLLFDPQKGYVDVGIRDIHQPIEIYDSLLSDAGFKDIKRIDISEGHDCSYAVLYVVKK